jgi:VWFA-related protein
VKSPRTLAGVAAIVALSLMATTPLLSQALQRTLYVSVVDQSGAPVPDLGPGDFVVREDNLSREVLRVAAADDPMQIALLVDNSTAARDEVINMRRALPEFIDALLKPLPNGQRNQVAIVTMGERPTILADYTFDRAQLVKAIDRIWEQTMAGNYLLDTTMEVMRGFKRREAARPVIIAITTDGPELSFTRHEAVMETLTSSNVSFNIISLGRPSVQTDDASISRNTVMDQGPARTGGFHDRLLTGMTLLPKLQQVANVLRSEYRVTYAHPDTLIPPDKVTVSARRPNLTARGRLVREDTQRPQARP